MKAEACREDEAGAERTGRNPGTTATRAEADLAARTRTKAEAVQRLQCVS